MAYISYTPIVLNKNDAISDIISNSNTNFTNYAGSGGAIEQLGEDITTFYGTLSAIAKSGELSDLKGTVSPDRLITTDEQRLHFNQIKDDSMAFSFDTTPTAANTQLIQSSLNITKVFYSDVIQVYLEDESGNPTNEIFLDKINRVAGDYKFEYINSLWYLNSTAVNLSDYGIRVDVGTSFLVNDGKESFTINYTLNKNIWTTFLNGVWGYPDKMSELTNNGDGVIASETYLTQREIFTLRVDGTTITSMQFDTYSNIQEEYFKIKGTMRLNKFLYDETVGDKNNCIYLGELKNIEDYSAIVCFNQAQAEGDDSLPCKDCDTVYSLGNAVLECKFSCKPTNSNNIESITFLKMKARKLPDTHTELDYVGATGSQDVGILEDFPQCYYRAEMIINCDPTVTQTAWIIGDSCSLKIINGKFWLNTNAMMGEDIETNIDVPYGKAYVTITFNSNGCTLTVNSTNIFTDNNPISQGFWPLPTLFLRATMNLYELKIYDVNRTKLYYDMQPSFDNVNNVACLYDFINKKSYYGHDESFVPGVDEDLSGYIISGSTPPSLYTVGTVGLFYKDTSTNKLYRCTSIIEGSGYKWELSMANLYYNNQKNCLCFTANTAGSTIAMSVTGTPTLGQNFSYSINRINWNTFIPGTTIITLENVGDKVYFKGNNTNGVNESESIYYKFVMTGSIAASGNIMSLIDNGECTTLTIPNRYCYHSMFNGCVSLTTPPELPATTLAHFCYYSMFYGCTSLTTAPELPTTTLAYYCYYSMFYGCTSLTTAPELPASTLAENCYSNMFYNCTALTTVPALSATTLANYCCSGMFKGCTRLTTVPALPATTLANSCYYEMFRGCTSLTTAPTLSATTLAEQCYNNMFRGCTSLTTAPALPATIMKNACYYQMFMNCTSLATAPTLPATTLAENCYCMMFDQCTSLTTAPELPATTLANFCYRYMFYGCTSLTTAPELPAIKLMLYDYYGMFQACTSLTIAPELPATTLSESCYDSMFYGCTLLTTAPELPATALANYCYSEMFRGCTSLTTAPELPATTLKTSCYAMMFYGCTSLTTVPELSATTLANCCYKSMFQDCTSLYVSYIPVSEIAEQEWRIPTVGIFTTTNAQSNMFTNCKGTRSSDNMPGEQGQAYTYYTQNIPVSYGIPIPVVIGNLEYTGNEQQPTVYGYDPSVMTQTGTTSAVNVGTYTITYKLNNGLVWSDNTSGDKSFNWSISKISVGPKPTTPSAATYDGNVHTNGYTTPTGVTMTGSNSGTNAGTYTATYTPDNNYCWSDNTCDTVSITLTINKASVGAKPTTPAPVTYTGSIHTNGYTTPTGVTMTGNNSGTNAGTYTATYTPDSNHCWSDGTSNTIHIILVINKVTGTLSISPTSVTFNHSLKETNITVTSNCLGTINISSLTGVTSSISGTTIKLTGDGSTTISDGSITVSVSPDKNHTTPSNVTITVNAHYLINTTWQMNNGAGKGTGTTYNVSITTSAGDATSFIAPLQSFRAYLWDDEKYHTCYYYCEVPDSWWGVKVRYGQDESGNEVDFEYNDETNRWEYYGGGMVSHDFTITGGTDVTNTTLINWLYANATLQN